MKFIKNVILNRNFIFIIAYFFSISLTMFTSNMVNSQPQKIFINSKEIKGLENLDRDKIINDFIQKLTKKGFKKEQNILNSELEIYISIFHRSGSGFTLKFEIEYDKDITQNISFTEPINKINVGSLLESNEWNNLCNKIIVRLQNIRYENLQDSLKVYKSKQKVLKANIQKLESKINEKDNRITNLNLELNNKKDDIERQKSTIDTLRDRTTTLRDTVRKLEERLKKCESDTLRIFGNLKSVEESLRVTKMKLENLQKDYKALQIENISNSQAYKWNVFLFTSIVWLCIASFIYFITDRPVYYLGKCSYKDFKEQLTTSMEAKGKSIKFESELGIGGNDIICIDMTAMNDNCILKLVEWGSAKKVVINSFVGEKTKRLKLKFNFIEPGEDFETLYRKYKKTIKSVCKGNKSKIAPNIKKANFQLFLPIY